MLLPATTDAGATGDCTTKSGNAVPLLMVMARVPMLLASLYSVTWLLASATVVNTGTGPALGSMLKVFLSTDNLYDANDVLLTQGNIPELLANQSATLSNLAFVVPTTATLGTAYVLFVADANAQITETNENNNIINQTITLISNTPDLIIQNPTAPRKARLRGARSANRQPN